MKDSELLDIIYRFSYTRNGDIFLSRDNKEIKEMFNKKNKMIIKYDTSKFNGIEDIIKIINKEKIIPSTYSKNFKVYSDKDIFLQKGVLQGVYLINILTSRDGVYDFKGKYPDYQEVSLLGKDNCFYNREYFDVELSRFIKFVNENIINNKTIYSTMFKGYTSKDKLKKLYIKYLTDDITYYGKDLNNPIIELYDNGKGKVEFYSKSFYSNVLLDIIRFRANKIKGVSAKVHEVKNEG